MPGHAEEPSGDAAGGTSGPVPKIAFDEDDFAGSTDALDVPDIAACGAAGAGRTWRRRPPPGGPGRRGRG